MDVQNRAERARDAFLAGCNCPQSVVSAFGDVLAQEGIDADVALRLASPFGGGMGRMREVCGAFSGMLIVLGVVEGYGDPADDEGKTALYERVQELAGEFRKHNGALLCRDLLALGEGASAPTPEQRTDAYYASRPCARICENAARILATHLDGRGL